MARTTKRLITPEEYNKAARLKAKKMTKILLTFFVFLLSVSIIQVVRLQLLHRYKGVNLVDRSKAMFDNKNITVANRGMIVDAQGNH